MTREGWVEEWVIYHVIQALSHLEGSRVPGVRERERGSRGAPPIDTLKAPGASPYEVTLKQTKKTIRNRGELQKSRIFNSTNTSFHKKISNFHGFMVSLEGKGEKTARSSFERETVGSLAYFCLLTVGRSQLRELMALIDLHLTLFVFPHRFGKRDRFIAR